MFQINVACFDAKQFLRPAASFPRVCQQVAEWLIPYQGHDGAEFIFANGFVAATSLRFLDMFQWIRVDVAILTAHRSGR